MRYMAKDKIIYPALFFLIASVIYLVYLCYDYKNQNTWWIKEFGLKKQEDSTMLSPNALLLGGSNVMYSLSAKQLSDLTGYSWYNLGVSSEAFNDKNYWDFVSSSLDEKQRSEIDLVVYSGITLFRDGYLSSRANENSDMWGNRKLSWLPNNPLAARLKNSLKGLTGKRKYPLPVARGDFNFEKMKCTQKYQEAFAREMNWEEVQRWLDSQVSIISERFPNAVLIFVMPSEFYGKAYDRNTDVSYSKRLKSLIQSKFGAKIDFLAQPPYPERSMTCDGRHHANSVGRAWRTEDLFNFLKSRVE